MSPYARRPVSSWRGLLIAGVVVGPAVLFGFAGLAHNSTVAEVGLDLLVVPVAAAAYFYGLRSAVVAGTTVGSMAVVLYLVASPYPGGRLISSLVLLFIVAVILGRASDRDRISSRFLSRRYQLSNELLAATKDGRFEKVNPEWKRQLGYDEPDLLGRAFLDLVHPEDQARVIASRERLGQGGEVDAGPARMRRSDGRYVWIEWAARHDVDDGLNYLAGRDFTDRHDAEETLALRREMLERAVAERTQELQTRSAELDQSMRELEITRRQELRFLAMIAEFRDDKTAAHTERVATTSALIATELGLPEQDIELIRDAAPLHDIGKIGTPDSILLSTGQLTDNERSIMRQHTYLGYQLLQDSVSPVLKIGAVIALHHHERWDGTGYPVALKGEEIPLEARIVALADVFDALTSDRPYKPAWTLQDARREILSLSGRQFDPAIVDAFLRIDAEQLKTLAQPIPHRERLSLLAETQV